MRICVESGFLSALVVVKTYAGQDGNGAEMQESGTGSSRAAVFKQDIAGYYTSALVDDTRLGDIVLAMLPRHRRPRSRARLLTAFVNRCWRRNLADYLPTRAGEVLVTGRSDSYGWMTAVLVLAAWTGIGTSAAIP